MAKIIRHRGLSSFAKENFLEKIQKPKNILQAVLVR
jgi:hypothetical protein